MAIKATGPYIKSPGKITDTWFNFSIFPISSGFQLISVFQLLVLLISGKTKVKEANSNAQIEMNIECFGLLSSI